MNLDPLRVYPCGEPIWYPLAHFQECLFLPICTIGPLGGFRTNEITLYVETLNYPSSLLYFISNSNELERFQLLAASC